MMQKQGAYRRVGLVVGVASLIAATSAWAQSAVPAEIQLRLQHRPVQVAAAAHSDQRIRTPPLIITGGPQAAVPTEIEPERQPRASERTEPTCSHKCARTPSLIIIGKATAVEVAAAADSDQRIRTPPLIITGGPQAAVPAEIEPRRQPKPVEVAAPTHTYRRVRTPGLLIVGQ